MICGNCGREMNYIVSDKYPNLLDRYYHCSMIIGFQSNVQGGKQIEHTVDNIIYYNYKFFLEGYPVLIVGDKSKDYTKVQLHLSKSDKSSTHFLPIREVSDLEFMKIYKKCLKLKNFK